MFRLIVTYDDRPRERLNYEYELALRMDIMMYLSNPRVTCVKIRREP